jgi:NADH-quinone oxidoreductase subunit J
MTLPFAIIAVLNLVHSALAVAVAFGGLALAYLYLDAQFVGLTQILVYVGAVAILIVFAVLLTRGGEAPEKAVFSASWFWGILITVAVFATLAWCVMHSFASQREPAEKVEVTVKQIGEALMTKFVLPLEVIGLLLTAALIGAVIIAMRDEIPKTKIEDGGSKLEKSAAPSSILHPPSSQGGHQ